MSISHMYGLPCPSNPPSPVLALMFRRVPKCRLMIRSSQSLGLAVALRGVLSNDGSHMGGVNLGLCLSCLSARVAYWLCCTAASLYSGPTVTGAAEWSVYPASHVNANLEALGPQKTGGRPPGHIGLGLVHPPDCPTLLASTAGFGNGGGPREAEQGGSRGRVVAASEISRGCGRCASAGLGRTVCLLARPTLPPNSIVGIASKS